MLGTLFGAMCLSATYAIAIIAMIVSQTHTWGGCIGTGRVGCQLCYYSLSFGAYVFVSRNDAKSGALWTSYVVGTSPNKAALPLHGASLAAHRSAPAIKSRCQYAPRTSKLIALCTVW